MGNKKKIKKLKHLIKELSLRYDNATLENNKYKEGFIRPRTHYGFLGGKTWVCNLEPCPKNCSICGFQNYRPED